jgi:hypothetical protein
MMKIKNIDYSHPFGGIAEQIKRARAERKQRAEIFQETKAIVERAFDAQFLDINGAPVTEVARRILEAGMKRRAEIVTPTFSDDKHGRFARALENAARKRDGKEPI